MADNTENPGKSRPTRTRSAGATPPATAVPEGSILSADALVAGGVGGALALEADVSGELAQIAPSFGDILASIGRGVADSQTALDSGLVATATTLSQANITVVTDVVQELNDDGLPVPSATQLLTQNVSLINFVRPTAHQWSHVALRMDMTVGAVDSERGITVTSKSSSERAANAGLFFGFLGIGVSSFKSNSTFRKEESDFESNWAEGRVVMDALLQPRNVEGFDPPAEVTIGPQIFLALGSVQETLTSGVVTARATDIVITVRKADGSVNPAVAIDFDPGPFDLSFATTDGFTGNTTNASGQCRVTLSRNIPSPLFQRRARGTVTATLGQIERSLSVSL
jgi:hypothetical protein